MKRKGYWIICLHCLFFLYSVIGVFSKLAAAHPFASAPFLLLCFGILIILVVYAFEWQQVLHNVPLIFAYVHRAIVVFWGLIFSHFLFDEPVTVGKLLGMSCVMGGLVLFDLEQE